MEMPRAPARGIFGGGMEMFLKRFRSRYPLGYCVATLAATTAVILLTSLLTGFTAGALARGLGPAFRADIWADEYVLTAIQELLAAGVMLLLLHRSGLGWVLRQRGGGLGYGLDVGRFPVILITLALVETSSYHMAQGARLAAPWHIGAFLAMVALVGVAEELAFRGMVATTLLQRFGTTRSGVWKAVIGSGVLFGLAHSINFAHAEPLGVLIQMIDSAVLGMLLTAIYYRSGNLWVTVLLHAYMDLTALLESGLLVGEGLSESVSASISEYGVQNLLAAAVYLVPTIYLLRKRALPGIHALWEQQTEEPPTQNAANGG